MSVKFKSIRKVLLTGHKGFIGKYLYLYLSRHGIEVFGLEKEDRIDIDVFNKVKAVIHLGAVSSTTVTDEKLVMDTNVKFPQKLYRLCEERNIPFLFTSSASVYGDDKNMQEDKWDYKPKNLYGQSKYLFDQWIRDNSTTLYQGFRPFNVYGKTEDKKGNQASPVFKFSKQAKERGFIEVFERSEKYFRDFVSVEDVCLMILSFLWGVDDSGFFNLGTGKPISFLNVADLIAEKYNAEIRFIEMPENLVQHYQYYTKADVSKISKYFPNFKWTSVEQWLNRQFFPF